MRAAEVALDVFLHVAPLLVRHHHAANAVERCQTAGHRTVIAEKPIAMQFNEIAEAQPQIIQGVRSLWMTRDFHTIPRTQIGVNLLFGRGQVRGDPPHFGVEIDRLAVQVPLEIVQLLFEFEDRLLKIQGRDVHGEAETNRRRGWRKCKANGESGGDW